MLRDNAKTSASQVIRHYEREFRDSELYVPLQSYQVRYDGDILHSRKLIAPCVIDNYNYSFKILEKQVIKLSV